MTDLRYAVRSLRKSPGVTLVAVVTLALGIGATTAIFSAVHGILLRRLPLGDPERLVLFDDGASEGLSSGDPNEGRWRLFSFDSYRHFTGHRSAFQDLAAFASGEDRLSVVGEGRSGGAVQLAWGHLVSGNFFSVLRASPGLGRMLEPGDDLDGAPPATVISDGYWRGRWGGDSSVVGRTVSLNGQPFTIVGVMPPSFSGLRVREPPDFWIPLHFQPAMQRRSSSLTARDVYWLNLVGRLAPGARLSQAQAEATVALRRFLIAEAGSRPTAEYQRAIERASIRLASGARGVSGLREEYAESLRVLMAVVAFVLLIASANIANLLLSRAVDRRSEITMRLALGASRGRLARQLLVESLVLAVLGGAAGLGLAQWGVQAFKTLVVPSGGPVDLGLNLPVLLFTTGVSLAAGVLFGLAPAWRAGRHDLASALRSRSDAGGGRRRAGFAPALVVGQVGLSLILLVGSSLLIRSLINLARQDLDFARHGILLVDLNTRISGLDSAALPDYYRRLIERVNAVPGVRRATLAGYSPMSGSRATLGMAVEGVAPPPGGDAIVDVILVGPRYAEVLGMSLLRGRDIGEQDAPGTAPVALVNEAFARSFLAGQDPVGHRLRGTGPSSRPIEIVGVVSDARFHEPKRVTGPMVFLPTFQAQGQALYAAGLEVRVTGDPMDLLPGVRGAVAEVDPRVPIDRVTTLDAQVREMMWPERVLAWLVSTFGALAAILACVGLYGVVSRAVARRTSEIGVRMALGARREEILGMVLRESGGLILMGIGIGIPGALLASRLIRNQLFGLGPADPVAMVAAAALLLGVALVAGLVPAWRASRLEPVLALRSE